MRDERTVQKRPRGGQANNANAKKAGIAAAKKALRLVGTTGIDGRTALGRDMAQGRQEIHTDLGGTENISRLKRDLAERYLMVSALADAGFTWIFDHGAIDRRSRRLRPLVREVAGLVESANRMAAQLGLERVPKPTPSLQDILRSHEQRERDLTESSPDDVNTQPAASNGEDEGTEEEQQLESTAVPAPHSLTAMRSEGGSNGEDDDEGRDSVASGAFRGG